MLHPTRGNTAEKAARARELRREMTPEERILWRELRQLRAQGYTFRRQQVLAGFIVDFYCHTARLVVEVDGGIHEAEQQAEYDTARDELLAAHGLHILRASNVEVRHALPIVLRRIRESLTPQPPLPRDLTS